jgi:hypothetical protein
MSLEEAEKVMMRDYGSYAAYRQSVLNEQVPQQDVDALAACYEAFSKAEGLSLGEFFAKYPGEWKRYLQAVQAG